MSLVIRSMVLFAAITSLAVGGLHQDRQSDQARAALRASIDEHGGSQLIAAAKDVHSTMTRVTQVTPDHSFERRLDLSQSGEKFVRMSSDPAASRVEIETFDGSGFDGRVRSRKASGDEVEEALPSDANRLVELQASNLSTGLLPILKLLIEPEAEVGTLPDAGQLKRFRVATSQGTFIIHTDRTNLIRKVNFGATTMVFADVRAVSGLSLPFVERVLVGNRVVFDIFFSSIEIDASPREGHFDLSWHKPL